MDTLNHLTRAELVSIILAKCLLAKAENGTFSRQEAFRLMALKSRRVYRIFEELIDDGSIIPIRHKVYRLNPAISTSVKMAMQAPIEKESERDNKVKEISEAIIAHLNGLTGRSFRCTEKVKTMVSSRLREGAKGDDFIKVIDRKYKAWIGTKFASFLRPETLFGNKFDGYLNEIESQTKVEKMESYQFDRFFK